MKSIGCAAAGVLALFAGQAAFAQLSFGQPTSTVINAGSTSSENYEVLSISTGGPVVVNPTVTYTIGDTFNQTGSTSTQSNFGSSATGSGAPWNFQDNFAFSTSAAEIFGTQIAFTTNMTDLQARIVSATDSNGNPVPITTNTNAAGQELIGGSPLLTIINGWTTYTSGETDFTVLMPNDVPAGSYILQIRGEAVNPAGSYGGTITFDAVPLPAALPLLFSGLMGFAGFGGLIRRRRGGTAAALA
jgi:hypothetical protein